MVLFDTSVGHDEIKAWFGNKSKEELQRITRTLIPEKASFHPSGVSQYMKEIWSGEFLLGEYYQQDYNRALEVYGIINQN